MVAQNSLFDEQAQARRARVAPLAVRMRPCVLDEFVGQEHIAGPESYLRRMIAADTLSSLLFYGPAGTGKTTLARIIAASSAAYFEEVSAVTGSVADLRRAIKAASDRLGLEGQRTILFIDEIHRFSKSQQDALLHAVEDRIVVLIGATTENPYFEVNSPLVSRSRVLELRALRDEDIRVVLERAVGDERGLAGQVVLDADALDALVLTAGGDARVALTSLELAAQLATAEATDTAGGADADSGFPHQDTEQAPASPRAGSLSAGVLPRITRQVVADISPSRMLPYDKGGDVHYDVISAFIKSLRGSDVDAALYWLARMLQGGEDPKFIARRLLILASEDVGNADPRGLLVAEAAFRSVEVIGLPECRINLAQATVYLALAPKSNASYIALEAAAREVATGPARAVPNHLRDRHRPGSDDYGPYSYPHNASDAWVEQQYLPDGITRGAFYQPTMRGWEHDAACRLDEIRAVSGQNADTGQNATSDGRTPPKDLSH